MESELAGLRHAKEPLTAIARRRHPQSRSPRRSRSCEELDKTVARGSAKQINEHHNDQKDHDHRKPGRKRSKCSRAIATFPIACFGRGVLRGRRALLARYGIEAHGCTHEFGTHALTRV